MDRGRRRDALADWLANDLLQRLEQRLLAVDEAVAFAWGVLIGDAKRRGCALSSMDGMIAATALAHGLTLATRNIEDFTGCGIELIDPWAG